MEGALAPRDSRGQRQNSIILSVHEKTQCSRLYNALRWEARGIFTEPLRQPRDRSAQSTKNAKLGGKAEGEEKGGFILTQNQRY